MKHHIDLSRSELNALIDEWILDERNRKIIKRRLLDNKTFSELEGEFNLCERHIKTIVYKGEQIIASKIEYH
jgi:DNA-directed RNA polymerase sigma subunit (sigma70/sigma32)